MVDLNKIEKAIKNYNLHDGRDEDFGQVCDLMLEYMLQGGEILVAVDAVGLKEENFEEEGMFVSAPGIGLVALDDGSGASFIVAYTSKFESDKDKQYSAVADSMRTFFEAVNDIDEVDGIVINPYGNMFMVDKDLLAQFMEAMNA